MWGRIGHSQHVDTASLYDALELEEAGGHSNSSYHHVQLGKANRTDVSVFKGLRDEHSDSALQKNPSGEEALMVSFVLFLLDWEGGKQSRVVCLDT